HLNCATSESELERPDRVLAPPIVKLLHRSHPDPLFLQFAAQNLVDSLAHCSALTPRSFNALSFPLQTPFTPSPNEPFNQEQQENQYRDEGADRQTRESHCEWHQKDRFDIKDQEDDRVQIVLRAELNLCFTKRFDAAFINRVFLRAWFRRLKNSP